MASFRLMVMDYREADFTGDALAVYADPPYYGKESHYRCERVELADLIPVMERAAPIRALSLSEPMLSEALPLIEKPHTCGWFKHYAKPGGWPIYSWEPVIIWGPYPAERTEGELMPRDCLLLHSGGPNYSDFWAPKPDGFADWVLSMVLGTASAGYIVDMFSGSGSISRAAMRRGISSIGVDILSARGAWRGDWQRPTLAFPPFEDQDQSEICPRASRGYPAWLYWWTNRHQWKPVYRSWLDAKGNTTRRKVPGLRSCVECFEVRLSSPCSVPVRGEWVAGLLVRKTVGINDRQWLPVPAC